MVIVVANVKGGVGKTTSAVYLAAAAAEDALGPVILVDGDPQASASVWLEERPLDGVTLVEAPSERFLVRAVELGAGAMMVVDTPPGNERQIRAALEHADVVVIASRVGALEPDRVTATLAMVASGCPVGLVLTSTRPRTRDHRETMAAWIDAGIPVWGSVPERVAVAAGPDSPLNEDALTVYRQVLVHAKGMVRQ